MNATSLIPLAFVTVASIALVAGVLFTFLASGTQRKRHQVAQGQQFHNDASDSPADPKLLKRKDQNDPARYDHEYATDKNEARKNWLVFIQTAGFIGVMFAGVIGYNSLVNLNIQTATLNQQFTATNRAWIRIELADKDLSTKLLTMTEWAFLAHIANRGHSPAKNIVIFWNLEIPRYTDEPTFRYDGLNSRRRIGLLFPEENPTDIIRMTQRLGAIYTGQEIPMTSADRQAITNGDRYVAIYTRIAYTDAFGRHWTHQCFWGATSPAHGYQAETCMKYNTVGDGEDQDPEPK